MRRKVITATFAAAAFFAFDASVNAQTDELRAATGLPMQIGQKAVFGKITLRKYSQLESKPSIFVTLMEGGTQLERIQTNGDGWYRFIQFPRGSATILVEVNNQEITRMVISPGASNTVRQDFDIDWAEAQRLGLTGVISAKDLYPRNAETSKAFDSAMKYIREKELAKADAILRDIIAKDPKDYVAWTELGTIFFKNNNLSDAEACYFKAVEIKSDYFLALLNLGKLYLSRKQLNEAILVLSNAIRSNAKSADAQFYMGEAYLLAKKGSLAVAHLNEALKLEPKEMAEAHLLLATLYDAAKMKDKASAEYLSFLAKKPDYAEKAQLEKYIAENPPK